MTALQNFVFGVLPYICGAIFLVGMYWRYKYDAYGWTTRSSQMYESRLLRIGSPMFHIGLILALGGHVLGLLVPAGWTEAVGVSEHAYHLAAVTFGVIAGVMVVVGFTILVFRRRTVGRVFQVTTRSDKIMYVVLGSVIVLGIVNTFGINWLNVTGGYPDGFNYRESVALWFRSLFVLQPAVSDMTVAPWSFQLHAVMSMILFAIVPFTRLVHIFSAPLGYVARPYLVYRSRDPQQVGARDPRRGWEPVRK